MDDLQHIANIENLEMDDEPIHPHSRFNNINPFEILSEYQFIQMFRLGKELVRYLIDLLTPHMSPQRRATDLSIMTRASFTIDLELQEHNINQSIKRNIKEVNAAPSEFQQSQQTQPEGGNNIVTNLLAILCGTLCKDTLTTEVVPPPTQNSCLNAMFSDLRLEGFSKDVCRSMVAMLDEDRSGKLGFEEFKKLWTSLRHWKNVWKLYDIDRSGTFSGFELREALNSAGYRLNNRVLNILMHRYGNRQGEIHFDDFLMCAVKLKTMIDIYKLKDEKDTNKAIFSLEEWLENTLYS